jgi:dihydropteroate synthase
MGKILGIMGFMVPLRCGRAVLDGSRTYVMGVVNITPDSFSDGGRYVVPEAAVALAEALVAEGADVLDVGGESTRPGAKPVDEEMEWARLGPVLAALVEGTGVPISVDTYKGSVARRALAEGAALINDVTGGRDPELLAAAAAAGAPVVLGHLRGAPTTMQEGIVFTDVFEEVAAELGASVARARAAGVEQLVVDPGIGFGKTVAHNLELLGRAGELGERLGLPVMVGPSRKGFLGHLTGRPVTERLPATLGAVVAAVLAGADFVRVHEVRAVRDALVVARAVKEAGEGGRRRAGGGG